MITILANPEALHQASHARAMADGLAAHGVETVIQRGTVPVRTRRVVCWGWHKGAGLRAAGHDVLVMERGYLGDRFAWTSLAWNGLNGRGAVPAPPDDGGERFRRHFAGQLLPWRPSGAYVLLVGQVPGDASLQGRDLNPWYRDMAVQASARYGMAVRFRPHPVAIERGVVRQVPGAPQLQGSLSGALGGAAVVVTFNSNTGVDALLAGKPTVVADVGSMAWSVAMHSLEEPLTVPDRLPWAHALAWRQFTIDEIRSGFAWSVVATPETETA